MIYGLAGMELVGYGPKLIWGLIQMIKKGFLQNLEQLDN